MPLPIGQAEVVYETPGGGPAEVAIFALGAMLPEGRRLAGLLEAEGQSVALINPRFAKPVDEACIARYARRCELVVTMEDHVLAGGFGSAVLESMSSLESDVPLVRVGWPDSFIEHGRPEDLRRKYGLTAEAALALIRAHSKRLAGV